MSALRDWLAGRDPAPPRNLAVALRGVAGAPSAATSTAGAATADAGVWVAALMAAGRERMDRALARPGRERQSAFRLLEADALLTYACEAALEAEEPEVVLRRILTVAGR